MMSGAAMPIATDAPHPLALLCVRRPRLSVKYRVCRLAQTTGDYKPRHWTACGIKNLRRERRIAHDGIICMYLRHGRSLRIWLPQQVRQLGEVRDLRRTSSLVSRLGPR